MISRDIISESEGNVILQLQVKPNSKKQEITLDSLDRKIAVFVKAPPDKGKANKELLKFIARILEKNSTDILIIAGQTSRDKTVLIKNALIQNVERKIIEYLKE
ncbi:MAG: YggU family protein [Candidatus Heimdallarchaeota archaeon]|nr:YggU family protein [Candidatus Heimdallarchaeota archaeon]MBY8993203.1 YggU family protein [Candidatus Heimdallarchaeota archaeon]